MLDSKKRRKRKYSIMGEQGAANLDAAEEATTRMENLEVAREMEARFKEIEGSEEHQRMVEATTRIRTLDPIKVDTPPANKDESLKAYLSLSSATNKETGVTVQFYHSAFKKDHKDGGPFEKATPALGKAFENSVLAYTEGDSLEGTIRPDGTVHKGHKNIKSYSNYVGKVLIDGKTYYVRYTVQNLKNEDGVHSMFVTNVDVYENPIESQTIPRSSRGTTDFDGIVDAKLQNFFMLASDSPLTFAQRLKWKLWW